MPAAALSGVIFDLDGVIVDSEKLWTQVTLDFLSAHNVKISKKDFEREVKPMTAGAAFEQGTKIVINYFGLTGDITKLMEQRKQIILNRLNIQIKPTFQNKIKVFLCPVAINLNSLFTITFQNT